MLVMQQNRQNQIEHNQVESKIENINEENKTREKECEFYKSHSTLHNQAIDFLSLKIVCMKCILSIRRMNALQLENKEMKMYCYFNLLFSSLVS